MGCVRLVVFDMDGVLVPIKSSWGYIHEALGVGEEARRYMKMFLDGRIDYLEWMRLDTELWIKAAGGRLHRSRLQEILDRVPLAEGVEDAVRWLRRRGVRIALVSGGVDLLARRVARLIGAEAWMANMLSFDKEGYLRPGGVPLVGVDKARAVRRVAYELGVGLEYTAYVGDSMWDASAMRVVGYPILVGEGDEVVRRAARYRIGGVAELPGLIEEIEGRC